MTFFPYFSCNFCIFLYYLKLTQHSRQSLFFWSFLKDLEIFHSQKHIFSNLALRSSFSKIVISFYAVDRYSFSFKVTYSCHNFTMCISSLCQFLVKFHCFGRIPQVTVSSHIKAICQLFCGLNNFFIVVVSLFDEVIVHFVFLLTYFLPAVKQVFQAVIDIVQLSKIKFVDVGSLDDRKIVCQCGSTIFWCS